MLAGGLVVIVWRYQWFELEVFGILASYLNHYLWLRPIIEPMQGQHLPFKEFPYSAGLLLLYWLMFRMSYVFRKPADLAKERVSTFSALINPALLLTLLKYQSAHKEWAFWGLLAMGVVETALGATAYHATAQNRGHRAFHAGRGVAGSGVSGSHSRG